MSTSTPATGSTVTAERMMDSLPFYYYGEPLITRLVQAVANELDRVEAFLVAIQQGLVPTMADDAFHLLSIWEWVFDVPVNPPIPLEVRRQIIRGRILARFCMRAIDWERAMTTMLGTSNWTHREGAPGMGQQTIRVPFTSDTYIGGYVTEFARKATPANYEIFFGYVQGFIVGVSHVGDVL